MTVEITDYLIARIITDIRLKEKHPEKSEMLDKRLNTHKEMIFNEIIDQALKVIN